MGESLKRSTPNASISLDIYVKELVESGKFFLRALELWLIDSFIFIESSMGLPV